MPKRGQEIIFDRGRAQPVDFSKVFGLLLLAAVAVGVFAWIVAVNS
mgnify:CR=1 FL=1